MRKINYVNKRLKAVLTIFILCLLTFATVFGQTQEPKPFAPKSVTIPAVQEKKLKNGLTIAVVERKNVPLVSVQMLIGSGVSSEDLETAGLANMTADLLTKGTPTRTAGQIAEQMEFLGGSISTGANLETSNVTINVASDKINQAMQIMADVILHPTFPVKEINLAKSQALDELNYNLKQPSFLANYVASVYTFSGNPASGTPESIRKMNRKEISEFYRLNYIPENATLIFVGDIDSQKALRIAQNLFGNLKPKKFYSDVIGETVTESASSVLTRRQEKISQPLLKRFLVADLPDSGQASVGFYLGNNLSGRIVWDDAKKRGEINDSFFPAIVMNSIFGGGYSSRLNLEVRIKRGLSYGAGSNFVWSPYASRFSARAQTKNESAAEVAELILSEIEKLGTSEISENELASRKAVLTGDFGRDLETNFGLLGALSDLYAVWLPTSELNSYMNDVRAVREDEVVSFANKNLRGGDIIIVGDYAKFKEDLAKRFPNVKVEVIKADSLNLSSLERRY